MTLPTAFTHPCMKGMPHSEKLNGPCFLQIVCWVLMPPGIYEHRGTVKRGLRSLSEKTFKGSPFSLAPATYLSCRWLIPWSLEAQLNELACWSIPYCKERYSNQTVKFKKAFQSHFLIGSERNNQGLNQGSLLYYRLSSELLYHTEQRSINISEYLF